MTTASRPTFVVTRPRDDAGKLIDLLAERGHDVIGFPVIGIEPAADLAPVTDAMARVEDYGLAVFVSPNAIRHALVHRTTAWPATTVVGVMGPGSAAALHPFDVIGDDVRIVRPGQGSGTDGARFDSEALLESLDREVPALGTDLRPVLLVKGSGGRPWLADRLRARGHRVDAVEAYRRVRPALDAAAAGRLQERYRNGDAVAFIVTSSEGLAGLVDLVDEALGVDGPDDQRRLSPARTWLYASAVYAPHARIVEEARRAGFSTVVATRPGDEGIAATIK